MKQAASWFETPRFARLLTMGREKALIRLEG